MGKYLRHPLGQSVAVLVSVYLLIKFGIAAVSAPVPASVLLQYMVTVMVGLLLWVSDNEERWAKFKQPMHRVMVDPEQKVARAVLLLATPLLVAFVTFDRVRPSVAAPVSFRSIHPAPPGQIDFQGRTLRLTGLENPLRSRGSEDEHLEEGKRIYYQNCVACHGDGLAGLGHYSQGFNPVPLSFQDVGTIAQLTESVVFWRIAKGGPGLPNEGGPWNSAMPAWEDFLSEDDIWAVIMFLYDQAGHSPRTWGDEGEEGGH